MKKEELVFAINTLPEDAIVTLLNDLFEVTEIFENTPQEINSVMADDNPFEIVNAVAKEGKAYRIYDKWCCYDFDVLRSGNTLKSLIPDYDACIDEIAERYLDDALDDDNVEIINTALGKASENSAFKKEFEYKMIEDAGEQKLISLLRVMLHNGELDLIKRCLEDDDFRLACYRKYHITA